MMVVARHLLLSIQLLLLLPTRGAVARRAAHVSRPARLARTLSLRGGEMAPSIPILVTEEDLDVVLEEAGSALVVVDFYAEWCGPCKQLAPVLEQLASQSSGKVFFYKVDVDQSRELAAQKGIKSMPTIQFYREGQQVKQIVGGDKAALRAEVMKATTHPLLRAMRSEYVLVATAVAYLLFPWQRYALA